MENRKWYHNEWVHNHRSLFQSITLGLVAAIVVIIVGVVLKGTGS